MPAQTMRRRSLLTGGSGVDSTTTAAGFAAGRAGVFGAGAAGGSATATDVCSFALLSTAEKPLPLISDLSGPEMLTRQRRGLLTKLYNSPPHRIDVSVKTQVILFTRSAAARKNLY